MSDDLRGLAAYDQARTWDRYWDEQFARDAERREGARRARHVAIAGARARIDRLRAAVQQADAEHRQRAAGARARDMREARERAGASCP